MISPKSFIGFTAVTAVIVIAAGVSVASRYGATSVVTDDARLFPALSGQLSDVTKVTVQDAEKTLTVKQLNGKWQLVSRQGYAASGEAIRDLLLGLSELRIRESKTKKPDRYTRLDVEDITTKKAKSKLLTVKGKDGSKLAEILVGKVNNEITGATNVGRYVRKPGDEQSWLVAGRLEVPDTVAKWVKPEFLSVLNKRVAKVTVIHPDGQTMMVSRAAAKGTKFKIENMPEGRIIEYQSDIDNMGDGLDKLELEDVKETGKVTLPKDKITGTEYVTTDGLIVDVELAELQDGNFWARFKARTADDASDDIKREAGAINAQTSKWIYQVPAHKYRYMSRKLSDVLKAFKDKKKGKK